jgi:alpha-glucosidase
VPGAGVAGVDAAARLTGDARLEASTGLVQLSADGPSFTVWRLPGVAAPGWASGAGVDADADVA